MTELGVKILSCPGMRNNTRSESGSVKQLEALSLTKPLQAEVEELSLASVRSSLRRLEECIVFSLMERAQYAYNPSVYTPGEPLDLNIYEASGKKYSLLTFVLHETEILHAKIRRFASPDEHPFFPEELPAQLLPPISFPPTLVETEPRINCNGTIMQVYLNKLLPEISKDPGDDGNYGSCSIVDTKALQALSRRIHFGKFVAEAKLKEQREEYTRLIKAGDAEAIMELLTDRKVEAAVLERVRNKASSLGQDMGLAVGCPERIAHLSGTIAQLYKEWIIPLTKKVEVEYLLRRFDGIHE